MNNKLNKQLTYSLINKQTNNLFKLSYLFITNFSLMNPYSSISRTYLKFIQKLTLKDPRIFVSKQFCKNILLFLSVLKCLQDKSSFNQITPNIVVFILPVEKTSLVFLKAPFVNKLSKKHYCIKRFKFLISINFTIKKRLKKISGAQINFFFCNIIRLFSFLESNICYTYKIIFKYPVFLK